MLKKSNCRFQWVGRVGLMEDRRDRGEVRRSKRSNPFSRSFSKKKHTERIRMYASSQGSMGGGSLPKTGRSALVPIILVEIVLALR